MNYSALEKKDEFLLNVKVAREERANETKKIKSIILLQSVIRTWLARRRYRKLILQEFEQVINDVHHLKLAVNIFHLIRKLFSVWNNEIDRNRLCSLCRYITKSLEEENISYNYIGVFLIKEHSVLWIAQLKEILKKCNFYLKSIFTDTYSNAAEPQNTMIILLHTMVSLTSINTWRIFNSNENLRILKPGLNQLCHNTVGFLMSQNFYYTLKEILCKGFMPVIGTNKITLTNTCLMAVMILTCRPLLYSDFTNHIMLKFTEIIFTVPALIYHVHNLSPQFFASFEEEQLLNQIVLFLKNCEISTHTDNYPTLFINSANVSESNKLLCFTANFIELGKIYLEQMKKKNQILDFMNALSFLLTKCQKCVINHRSSNLTQWHPILGWFSQDGYDVNLHESLPLIKRQLSLLWSKVFLSAILEESLQLFLHNTSIAESSGSTKINNNKNNFGKKALNLLVDAANVNVRWKNKNTLINAETKLLSNEITYKIMIACRLYHTMINTFIQLRLDILTGLCYQSDILSLFWKYFLSQNGGLKYFYRYVSSVDKSNELFVDVNFQILLLFGECMVHYITILDDVEMYEQQSLFHLTDFLQLSSFLNNFLYKGIINDIFRKESYNEDIDQLFTNLHRLLMVLYQRDCRRPYALNKTHWIIKEIKPSTFFHELEKNNKKILFLKEKMPYVISYQERVHLFKKYIFADKNRLREQLFQHNDSNNDDNVALNLPLPVRIIKIRRNHIVEDAFYCLHKLNSIEIKQAFRIKFLNEEGLEEAGIDQAGIFKEFMVDLLKKLFDPSLNLFRKTSNGHVYPSSMTNMSEMNHLDLIEFCGKMLAKAIYEGIVLDVRLASFFLSQILGQTQSSLYSYLDDLPSLDEELFRSLMYVKRYEGNVSDLCLTFSTTEDYFGTVVTRELVPGGKVTNVTEYNKIIYVHLMAYDRMHTQIKRQTIAFAKGFHNIFSKDSLNLFSVPELQLLISGEDEPLNFDQLRLHTQYYGGFHDSHKVIVWLWDILKNDFTEEERGLFLKFVTSSSKPPVLGFAFLNPPFSIRCVEVSEDEDLGDSVGSVIRGFFTIRKKGPEHRLPTSSTCFNLLKLPNYSRKNILKDKLRYAITANSGFELS